MRSNPFAKVNIRYPFPEVDLEYIADYSVNGKMVFHRVCELDSHTERALVAGGIAGYPEPAESWYGQEVNETKERDHCQVPNKGYIALWAEQTYSPEGMLIWGIYRHDSKVYLVKASYALLCECRSAKRVYWSSRFNAGLDNCGH